MSTAYTYVLMMSECTPLSFRLPFVDAKDVQIYILLLFAEFVCVCVCMCMYMCTMVERSF